MLTITRMGWELVWPSETEDGETVSVELAISWGSISMGGREGGKGLMWGGVERFVVGGWFGVGCSCLHR